MGAARRAKFEQQAMVLLVLVCGVALFNAMRRVGLIGRTGPAATSTSEALATAMQQLQDYQQTLQELGQKGELLAVPPNGYAADTVRNPLISGLQKEPPAEPEQPVRTAAPTSQPASAPAPRMPQVTVQGIILGNRPQAIIDRAVYGVGDTVQGATIVEITRDGVTLEVAGRRMVASPAAPTRQPTRTGGVP